MSHELECLLGELFKKFDPFMTGVLGIKEFASFLTIIEHPVAEHLQTSEENYRNIVLLHYNSVLRQG